MAATVIVVIIVVVIIIIAAAAVLLFVLVVVYGGRLLPHLRELYLQSKRVVELRCYLQVISDEQRPDEAADVRGNALPAQLSYFVVEMLGGDCSQAVKVKVRVKAKAL